VVHDPISGEVTEVHCTYDPASRGGDAPDGRKVRSTLHWVDAAHAIKAEVRLYDQLFTIENPDVGDDLSSILNSHSLEVLSDCAVEVSLKDARPGERFQFERTGYFCVDPDSSPDHLVVNRTVSLKDTWAKIEKKQG
jgi:glutaminyl-tRNA synthetase